MFASQAGTSFSLGLEMTSPRASNPHVDECEFIFRSLGFEDPFSGSDNRSAACGHTFVAHFGLAIVAQPLPPELTDLSTAKQQTHQSHLYCTAACSDSLKPPVLLHCSWLSARCRPSFLQRFPSVFFPAEVTPERTKVLPAAQDPS